jgi:hypothetical protein
MVTWCFYGRAEEHDIPLPHIKSGASGAKVCDRGASELEASRQLIRGGGACLHSDRGCTGFLRVLEGILAGIGGLADSWAVRTVRRFVLYRFGNPRPGSVASLPKWHTPVRADHLGNGLPG